MRTANQQMSLWDFYHEMEENRRVANNALGPFTAGKDEDISRYFDCNNYDACLTKASNELWQSFSCHGCRKLESRRGMIRRC